jgi:predicted GNAT superfamily acetyltransferase
LGYCETHSFAFGGSPLRFQGWQQTKCCATSGRQNQAEFTLYSLFSLILRPCALAVGKAFAILWFVPTPEITIRDIQSVDEMRAVEDLQQEVWGISEREIVSFMMFIPTLAVGGVLLGAFDDAELVGFSYGFTGHESGRVILHSDMLAVRAAYRNQRLGQRLKWAQRERALKAGIDCITWTFDPLQSRNAQLNFAKLGVIATDYKLDFYGPSSSKLHRGGTDRLWLKWHLDSLRVHERLAQTVNFGLPDAPRALQVGPDGEPKIVDFAWESAPEQVWLGVPLLIAEWQKDNLPRVARWRAATRTAFTQAFAHGFQVTEFYRHADATEHGAYLLQKV